MLTAHFLRAAQTSFIYIIYIYIYIYNFFREELWSERQSPGPSVLFASQFNSQVVCACVVALYSLGPIRCGPIRYGPMWLRPSKVWAEASGPMWRSMPYKVWAYKVWAYVA